MGPYTIVIDVVIDISLKRSTDIIGKNWVKQPHFLSPCREKHNSLIFISFSGEYSYWWILVGFLVLLYLTLVVLAYAGIDL